MAKRLRRRAGKWLHAQALIQEKNGTWPNAVGNIRAACFLLAGAPEILPAQEDSVRIEALAKKAAETVPPPVFKPVLTYPLNVPPSPAPPAPPAPQPPRHPANDVGVWPKTAPPVANPTTETQKDIFNTWSWIMGIFSLFLIYFFPFVFIVLTITAIAFYASFIAGRTTPRFAIGFQQSFDKETRRAIYLTVLTVVLAFSAYLAHRSETKLGAGPRIPRTAKKTPITLSAPIPYRIQEYIEDPEDEAELDDDEIEARIQNELEEAAKREADLLEDQVTQERSSDPWNE